MDDGMYITPERWRCGNDSGTESAGSLRVVGTVLVSAGAVFPECRQPCAESSTIAPWLAL